MLSVLSVTLGLCNAADRPLLFSHFSVMAKGLRIIQSVSVSLSALMSDAVAHTLDGCEVQPLGEELNPEREELLVDMEALKERGLDIINTTAYIAITGNNNLESTVKNGSK